MPSKALKKHLEMLSQLDCQDCGACCHSQGKRHVQVFGVDYDRMGDEAEEHIAWIENKAFLRMENGRCHSLAKEELNGAIRYRCTMYEIRPDACRALERGSTACAAEIELKER